MASTRRAPPDCVAGAAAFRAQLEGAQPGLFAMILRGVWADNCSYVQGELPRKAVCISATKLLCETDLITDAACFGTMLQSLLTMVLVDQGMEAAPPADAATQEIPDLEQENEGDGSTGYAAVYAQLTFASSSEWDAYAGEAVPSYLVGSLSRLNSAHPGQLSAIVTQIAQANRPPAAPLRLSRPSSVDSSSSPSLICMQRGRQPLLTTNPCLITNPASNHSQPQLTASLNSQPAMLTAGAHLRQALPAEKQQGVQALMQGIF
jgi:hypothetical protein